MDNNTMVLEEEIDENYEPSNDDIMEYAKWLGMDLPVENELLWIAREGLKAPLPTHWKPCRTEQDEIYYFNFATGESVWDHPCDETYRNLYQNEKSLFLTRRQQQKSPTENGFQVNSNSHDGKRIEELADISHLSDQQSQQQFQNQSNQSNANPLNQPNLANSTPKQQSKAETNQNFQQTSGSNDSQKPNGPNQTNSQNQPMQTNSSNLVNNSSIQPLQQHIQPVPMIEKQPQGNSPLPSFARKRGDAQISRSLDTEQLRKFSPPSEKRQSGYHKRRPSFEHQQSHLNTNSLNNDFRSTHELQKNGNISQSAPPLTISPVTESNHTQRSKNQIPMVKSDSVSRRSPTPYTSPNEDSGMDNSESASVNLDSRSQTQIGLRNKRETDKNLDFSSLDSQFSSGFGLARTRSVDTWSYSLKNQDAQDNDSKSKLKKLTRQNSTNLRSSLSSSLRRTASEITSHEITSVLSKQKSRSGSFRKTNPNSPMAETKQVSFNLPESDAEKKDKLSCCMGKTEVATPSPIRRFLSCDFFLCRFMHSGCLKQHKEIVRKLPFTPPLSQTLALLSEPVLPVFDGTSLKIEGLLDDDSPERMKEENEKRKEELAKKVKEKLKESQRNREILFREKMLQLQQRFEEGLLDIDKEMYSSKRSFKERKENMKSIKDAKSKRTSEEKENILSPLIKLKFSGDTSGDTTENAMTSFSLEDEEMLLKRLESSDKRKNDRDKLSKNRQLFKMSENKSVILRSVSEGNEFLTNLYKSRWNEDYEQKDKERLMFYAGGKKLDKSPSVDKKYMDSFAFDLTGDVLKSFSQQIDLANRNMLESDELEDVDIRYQAFKNLSNSLNSMSDKNFSKQEKGNEAGGKKTVSMGEQWEALDHSITLDQKYLSLDAMALNAEERALEWARKRGAGSGTYTEVSIGKTQSGGSFSGLESPEGFNQLWKSKSEKGQSNQSAGNGAQVTQLFEKLVDSEEMKLLPFARHEASLRVEKKMETEERKEWEKMFRSMQERVKASIMEEEKNMLQQERVEMLDRVDEILAKEEVDLLESKRKEMNERVTGDVVREEERVRETKLREMIKRVEEEMRDLEELERHSRVERIRIRAKELEKTVLSSERTKVIERVKKVLEIEKREYLERKRNEMRAAIESEEMQYLEKMRKEMFDRIKRILQEEGMKLLDLERSKNSNRRLASPSPSPSSSPSLFKEHDEIYSKFLNSDISERNKDIFRLHRWVSQKLEKVIHMKDYEEEEDAGKGEDARRGISTVVEQFIDSTSSASKSMSSEKKDSPPRLEAGESSRKGGEGGKEKSSKDEKLSEKNSDLLSMDGSSLLLMSPNRLKIEKQWLKESSKREEEEKGGMHRFPSLDTSVGIRSESLNFSEENSLLTGRQLSLPSIKSEDIFPSIESSSHMIEKGGSVLGKKFNEKDVKGGEQKGKGLEEQVKRSDPLKESKLEAKSKKENFKLNLLEELKSEMEKERPQIWMEVEAVLKSNIAGERSKENDEHEEKDKKKRESKKSMSKSGRDRVDGKGEGQRSTFSLIEENKIHSSLETKKVETGEERRVKQSFTELKRNLTGEKQKKSMKERIGLLFPLSEPDIPSLMHSNFDLDLDWEREKERLKRELEAEIKRETESKSFLEKKGVERQGKEKREEKDSRRDSEGKRDELEFSFGMFIDETELRRRLKEEMSSEACESPSLVGRDTRALQELAVLEMATNEKVEEEKKKLKEEAMKRLQHVKEEVEEKVAEGIERLKEEARRRLHQQIEEVEKEMQREREDARNERWMTVLSELEGEERSMVGEWREAMRREESLLRATYRNRMKQLRSRVERMSMAVPMNGGKEGIHGSATGFHSVGGDTEDMDDRGRSGYGIDMRMSHDDRRTLSPWDAFDDFAMDGDSVANSAIHRGSDYHRSSASYSTLLHHHRHPATYTPAIARSAPSAYGTFDSPSASLDDHEAPRSSPWGDESERSSVRQRRTSMYAYKDGHGIRLNNKRGGGIFGPRSPVHLSLTRNHPKSTPLYHSHSSASASHPPHFSLSGSVQASPSARSEMSWRGNPFSSSSRFSSRKGAGFEPILEVVSRHVSPKPTPASMWGSTRETQGAGSVTGKDRSSVNSKRERRRSIGGELDDGLARRLDDMWRADGINPSPAGRMHEGGEGAGVTATPRTKGLPSPDLVTEPIPKVESTMRSKSPNNRAAVEMQRGGMNAHVDMDGVQEKGSREVRGGGAAGGGSGGGEKEVIQEGENGVNWKKMVAGLNSRRRRRKWRKKAPSSLVFGEDPNDVYFSSSADSKNNVSLRKAYMGRFGKTPSV